MSNPISRYFMRIDKDFMAAIKDEQRRAATLKRLNRARTLSGFFSFFFVALLGVNAIWGSSDYSIYPVVLLIAQLVTLLDSDSKIMLINFYEMLSDANVKPTYEK